MSEPAGAAAGTAAGDASPAAPAPAPPPAAAPAAGADDRSPEEVLADAVNGDDDPAKQLEKAQADAKKWRDLSRKNEQQAKANAEAARKLAEIEDRDKTELQRATEAATAAEQRAAAAEQLYHRTLAAAQYDLPPELISAISGNSEDEINASAEALAAAVNGRVAQAVAAAAAAAPPAQAPGGNGRRPVESMRPGAAPAGDGQPQTLTDYIRQLAADRR